MQGRIVNQWTPQVRVSHIVDILNYYSVPSYIFSDILEPQCHFKICPFLDCSENPPLLSLLSSNRMWFWKSFIKFRNKWKPGERDHFKVISVNRSKLVNRGIVFVEILYFVFFLLFFILLLCIPFLCPSKFLTPMQWRTAPLLCFFNRLILKFILNWLRNDLKIIKNQNTINHKEKNHKAHYWCAPSTVLTTLNVWIFFLVFLKQL